MIDIIGLVCSSIIIIVAIVIIFLSVKSDTKVVITVATEAPDTLSLLRVCEDESFICMFNVLDGNVAYKATLHMNEDSYQSGDLYNEATAIGVIGIYSEEEDLLWTMHVNIYDSMLEDDINVTITDAIIESVGNIKRVL